MVEPWNVQDVLILSDKIEVPQYEQEYGEKKGDFERKVQNTEYSWIMSFKRELWSDVIITEKVHPLKREHLKPIIELLIEYRGLPDGKNTTKYAPETEVKVPEQRQDVDVGDMEQAGEKGKGKEKEVEGDTAGGKDVEEGGAEEEKG